MIHQQPTEPVLIERFLKEEAIRERLEKERHGLFLARQHDRRRKLLRALGVVHKGAADVSGICSQHRGHDPDCVLCRTGMTDLFPDWDARVREAEAAGTTRCSCGFVYYLTTRECPLCSVMAGEHGER